MFYLIEDKKVQEFDFALVNRINKLRNMKIILKKFTPNFITNIKLNIIKKLCLITENNIFKLIYLSI